MADTCPFDPTDGNHLTLPDESHFDVSGIELVGDGHYETADGQVWNLANTDYLRHNSFAMDTIISGTPDAANKEKNTADVDAEDDTSRLFKKWIFATYLDQMLPPLDDKRDE